MTENTQPNQEVEQKQEALTPEQAVDRMLAMETDHTAFARKLAIDNLVVSRIAAALQNEYNFLCQTIFNTHSNGTVMQLLFALRRAVNISQKRLSGLVAQPSQAVKPEAAANLIQQ